MNVATMLIGAMKPTLSHVIPSRGGPVSAVTSLGDDVFVARDVSNLFSNSEVEVYNAGTFSLQRCIKVPQVGKNVYGLAACRHHNCLYVSGDNNSIHRVQLSGSNAVTRWFAASDPRGLSVNRQRNVVVACSGANKLLEYTTRGTPEREISLQSGVTSPYYAIQLSTGDYVVSHHGGVTVVGVDGLVVRSCSASVANMSSPNSLVVMTNDDILVADTGNNRILSVNSSLSSAEKLALTVNDELQQPLGLYLDEPQGRLYVSEGSKKSRVLAFNNVKLCD